MTINSHEFPLPNKLGPETLRVIPLGGIGEIGRNMTVMQYNQDIVIVDVGVLFPEENKPGVDLALVDSTNAEVPGFVPQEKDIAPVIESIMSRAPRRVIVASFASHIHRVQQIIDAAKQNKRKV